MPYSTHFHLRYDKFAIIESSGKFDIATVPFSKMAALLRLHALRGMRRERVFRDRTHPFDLYNDKEMYKKYRFDRDGVRQIIDILQDVLQQQTERNHALTPTQQVFVALRFYATGSVLDSSATIHGVSRPTTSRVIRRVSLALCEIKDQVSIFYYCCFIYY